MVSDKFIELYQTQYESLKNYFKRQFSSDFADAEDLTQECFMRLLKHSEIYGERDLNNFYLFKIARNLKYDAIRRKMRYSTQSIDFLNIPSPIDVLDAVSVDFTLNALSSTDRALLELVTNKYSSFEIAKILLISPSAVRARIKKLKKTLKKVMDIEDIF